mmetsp:Transcript_16119/g.35373  ORF Transcript_16119/g.35373 Transcript_16119/m.35373 type:complete len:660 (-) Transcript_16119:3-1982(-)
MDEPRLGKIGGILLTNSWWGLHICRGPRLSWLAISTRCACAGRRGCSVGAWTHTGGRGARRRCVAWRGSEQRRSNAHGGPDSRRSRGHAVAANSWRPVEWLHRWSQVGLPRKHGPRSHGRRSPYHAASGVVLDPLRDSSLGPFAHSRVGRCDDDSFATACMLHLVHVDLSACVCSQLLDGCAGRADELSDQVRRANDRFVHSAASSPRRRHGGSDRRGSRRDQSAGCSCSSAAAGSAAEVPQVAHHVVEALLHLGLLLGLLLPVHVLALVGLHGLLTIRCDVALVSTDGASHIRQLIVALIVCLWTFETQVTQSTADTTPLLSLVHAKASNLGPILHSVKTGVLKLGTLRVEQRFDETLSSQNLLLGLTFHVHMLWHRRLLFTLPFVTDIATTNKDLASCCVLQLLVVDATGTDDDTHEGSLRELFDRNDNLLEQLGWFPIHWRQVAFHILDHVSDEPIVLCCHGLSDSDIAGVEPVTRLVVDRRRRRWSNVWSKVLKLVGLNFSVQVFQSLLSQELVDFLLRQAHGKIDVAERLVRLVVGLAPPLPFLGDLAFGPSGFSLGTLFIGLESFLVPHTGEHDGMSQIGGNCIHFADGSRSDRPRRRRTTVSKSVSVLEDGPISETDRCGGGGKVEGSGGGSEWELKWGCLGVWEGAPAKPA